MLLQYGLDNYDDGGYNFCVPPISNIYPRAFRPSEVAPELRHRFKGEIKETESTTQGSSPTGRYTDGLKNKVVVCAVANPVPDAREDELGRLQDQSCGYGIVRFHKPSREITMEAWPIFGNPAGGAEEQFAGWPQTIAMTENDGREAAAHLSPEVQGATDPVVQVISEDDEEILYTLRIQGQTFQPGSSQKDGRYAVKVSREGETWQEVIEDLTPVGETDQSPTVRVQL